jgi:hypothetical protein
MNTYAMAVLGIFLAVVAILAMWNSDTKTDDTIKSEARNEPSDWFKREK